MIAEAGEDETSPFLTAILARLRSRDGQIDVTLACAGHPLPMVRRAGGAVEAVGRCGTLLGVLPAIEAYDVDVSLAAADSLVFITDGIVEARNGSEQWGESRLKEVLRSETNASPAELARAVVSAATRYQQTANSDDIAVVVVTPSRRVTGR
jgi:sigma-B regulation protein RsbU (phosphoserine phosphatase)